MDNINFHEKKKSFLIPREEKKGTVGDKFHQKQNKKTVSGH